MYTVTMFTFRTCLFFNSVHYAGSIQTQTMYHLIVPLLIYSKTLKTLFLLSISHKMVAEANFALHETHCKRFLCLCPDCDEAVPRQQLDQHREEEHTLVRTYARKHLRTHARTHAQTHTHTQTLFKLFTGEMLNVQQKSGTSLPDGPWGLSKTK